MITSGSGSPSARTRAGTLRLPALPSASSAAFRRAALSVAMSCTRPSGSAVSAACATARSRCPRSKPSTASKRASLSDCAMLLSGERFTVDPRTSEGSGRKLRRPRAFPPRRPAPRGQQFPGQAADAGDRAMDIDRGALLQLFLTDSEEDLGRLEIEVLALETRRDDETVDGIFRIAHTLKGNAAILSLDGFARMAHAVEDVLHAVRTDRLAISGELASSLLAAVDALRAMLAALRTGRPDEPGLYAALESELAAWVAGSDAKDDVPGPTETTPPIREPSPTEPTVEGTWGPALRIEMAKVDQLLSLASRALVLQGQMGGALLESGAANGDLLELHQRNERLL